MEHTLTNEELLARVELWRQLGSYAAVAKHLGINESSVRRSIETATRRNLTDDFMGGAAPAGFGVDRTTTLYKDGRPVMEWQRRSPAYEQFTQHIDDLVAAMQSEITPLTIDGPLYHGAEDWLTLYPVTDVHLGQLSWHRETGEDYNLTIARQQFKASVTRLVAMSPMSHTAVIVFLGDYFHADNNNAETAKSHNRLDVDSRHDKTLFVGGELAVWFIDLALQKHKRVIVHVCRGNHDENSAKALAMALYFRYSLANPERVTVDIQPTELWSYEHGKTMLGFTHGDKVKAADMPGVMAGQWSEMWGRTLYRYAYSGHYHRAVAGPQADEKHGARWEILPAFTAKDAFNRSIGSSALRAIKSMTYTMDAGLEFTYEVTIR